MKRFVDLVSTALVLVLLFAPAFSQKEEKCDIAAYIADPTSGVNVRAGAGIGNRILKTIPRNPRGTLVLIDGAKGDWLKVSRGVNSDKTTVFSGTGWMHAPLLAMKTRGDGDDLVMYYRRPRTETEATGSTRTGLDVLVQGYSGDWIKVLIPHRGTDGIAAWMPSGSFCGSPWEDCVGKFGETPMNRSAFLSAVLVFISAAMIIPMAGAARQTWKPIVIEYDDASDRGILAAEYRIVRMKKGCRLTVRLTNKAERKLAHYWFAFRFKEGHEHENNITDHLPGKAEELTYESCGKPTVKISEVE